MIRLRSIDCEKVYGFFGIFPHHLFKPTYNHHLGQPAVFPQFLCKNMLFGDKVPTQLRLWKIGHEHGALDPLENGAME